MDKKINCWEYFKCGREPGGDKANEMGICPATTCIEANGFLEGKNGGRACAYVTGTFCSGIIRGTYNEKKDNCAKCKFYHDIKKEHGSDLSVISFTNFIKKNK